MRDCDFHTLAHLILSSLLFRVPNRSCGSFSSPLLTHALPHGASAASGVRGVSDSDCNGGSSDADCSRL